VVGPSLVGVVVAAWGVPLSGDELPVVCAGCRSRRRRGRAQRRPHPRPLRSSTYPPVHAAPIQACRVAAGGRRPCTAMPPSSAARTWERVLADLIA